MVQFVLMAQAALLHGELVQRGKADRIHLAALGCVHAGVEHLQHRGTARCLRLATHHLRGGHGVHRQPSGQAGVGPGAHFGEIAHRLGGNLYACNLLAVGPKPCIAHQHDVGVCGGIGLAEQAGDQLGANARGVAQGERDDG